MRKPIIEANERRMVKPEPDTMRPTVSPPPHKKGQYWGVKSYGLWMRTMDGMIIHYPSKAIAEAHAEEQNKFFNCNDHKAEMF